MIVRRAVVAWVASCLALVPAVVAPATAAAQEEAAAQGEAAQSEDARTLFQRGHAAYGQGDHETAIALWSRAYELDPRPLLQFNLSQSYERLGRLEEAVAALERYLEHAEPTDEHQAAARSRLAALRERLARTSVRVVGGPEGATIVIDGQDFGRTPRPDPIPVAPGSHSIVVRLSGYQDFTSTVVVAAGQSAQVAVEMREEEAPVEVAPVAQSDDSTVPTIVSVALLSAGGAALVAGGVMGGVALSDANAAPGDGTPEADAARGLALGADVTMGAGAALAVAGLVVLLVTELGGGEEQPSSVAVAPWGGATGGGVAMSVSF